MITALQTLTNKLADRFEMGSSENLPQTLMATAFRGQNVSQEQMTALLVVALRVFTTQTKVNVLQKTNVPMSRQNLT